MVDGSLSLGDQPLIVMAMVSAQEMLPDCWAKSVCITRYVEKMDYLTRRRPIYR